MEEAGKIEIVALDKTGTITTGEPKVTDVICNKGVTEKELISFAYALEKRANIRWQRQYWHMPKQRRQIFLK